MFVILRRVHRTVPLALFLCAACPANPMSTPVTSVLAPSVPATAARRGGAARQPHVDSRAPQVLDAAATLFCRHGFGSTPVRDIAAAAGILPGSLYCHFATKEDLLVAVYLRGVERICAAVDGAIAPLMSPWSRLEAACVAHLEAILRDDDYARVVVRVRPQDVPGAAPRLAALRERYEAMWRALVAALPLPRRSDRRTLRLLLLGALNWAPTWYRADGAASPRVLARRFIALLRQGLQPETP